MNKELDPREIKYGLIVIDPTQEEENLDILHFCGYWDKPTKTDAEHLREELMNDESFGLTEIAYRLDILPCPDYILKQYLEEIRENYE